MQNLKALFDEILTQLGSAIPNFFGALIIFIVGRIIAGLIRKLIKKVLSTIGVDKLAERLNDIEIVEKSNIKIVPSTLISKLVYYILLFIFIIAATDILGMPAVSQLMTDLLNYIPSFISAFIVLVIGLFLADFIKNIVLTTCKSLGIPAGSMIANVVFYFLLLNIVMITLTQAKIDTGFIQSNLSIILAGVVLAFALAYGYASRNIIANFLASFYNKNIVKEGDIIQIDGVKGKVIKIDNASIRIKADDRTVLIPIHKLTSEKIEFFDSWFPKATCNYYWTIEKA